MKKHLKRLLSLTMALLLCFGIFPSNAFAATYDYDGYLTMIVYEGRGYSFSSNLPAPFGGYTSEKFAQLRINDLRAYRTAYCIQLGVKAKTGTGYDASTDYADFSSEQKSLINTTLTLGYNVETGTKYGGSEIDEYIATQILIWLVAHNQFGTGYESQIVDEVTVNNSAAKPIFYALRENVVNYHTVPSFATDNPDAVGAYTHELKYNEETGRNETTLVDANNVLDNFSVNYPNVEFSISGNELHISTDQNEFGTITAEKHLPSSVPGVVTGGAKYWMRDEYQNVVTFDVQGSAQPVKCYFSLEIKVGTLQLVKTSEDGEVANIPFHISGNGIEKDLVTGPDGTIKVDNLQAGTYTVTERAPDKYVQPQSQQVTIYPGQTSSVNFSNILKKFRVEMQKKDSGHNLPRSSGQQAQGDATLDGAVYGMYKGETLLDTYTTSNGGKFTTKEYPCGDGYSIREITPSEGYLLDETIYPVGAQPGNFTLESNRISMTVQEDIILGTVAITKHTDQPAEEDGSGQIEHPEEGAQFEIYLASAGSYDAAKGSERDILTTDHYGFAQSKDLPYGRYVVHQIAGAEGQKFVPDFSVYISEHGKSYYFILNNPTFTSLIQFQKKDLESGKIIPLAGTAVKIRNTDTGEWVVQHLNYPSPIDIDTFVTDSTGTLMLPEPLPYGNYELIEQQSPWGYVLDSDPVPFVVDGSQDIITVEKYNIAQKGTITIYKEGEVFSHVVEAGGVYQPQYETQGLPDAVYDITASEDIITPDGTTHAKAGELVATLTTGSNGFATSEPLYLGRYQVVERTAPDGMVLNPEPQEVVLSYAGQEVEITSTSVGFTNERQKLELSLKKILEQDEQFCIGMNDEWKNITFGLFASSDITATDGTAIPKDGLLETTGLDANGDAVFKTDIPCGASSYIQEIGTDEHYILSDEKFPVEFEYAGQDVTTVQIVANGGVPIENILKRGKVSGWKVDQDGFELPDATIGLFRFDETEFTEETAIMVTESNEIGYFEFDKVPVGNWIVREIAPPAAFVLTEESFPVEITENGEIIEITIENQIIKGTVETTKVDADYPDHKLSGAVFEIYADVDNNSEFDADIDRLVGEMAESDPGLYQMKDLVYGSYFLHEKVAPEFFERDDGYYPFSVKENGVIVKIETKADVGFLNRAQTGTLKIVKIADDDKVANRTFRVSGTDFTGKVFEKEFQTDERGEINITLRVGEYTISEVAGEDSEKYELPADQTVEIKPDETITVKMHNKLMPETPTVPQTGETPWKIAIFGSLAILAGGILLVLHHMNKKRRTTNNNVDEQNADK